MGVDPLGDSGANVHEPAFHSRGPLVAVSLFFFLLPKARRNNTSFAREPDKMRIATGSHGLEAPCVCDTLPSPTAQAYRVTSLPHTCCGSAVEMRIPQ